MSPAAASEIGPGVRARLDSTTAYRRDEGQTFLTHPEWYIVYSSDEYAEWLRDRLPTDFPYVASIGQYWVNYREARALTRREYPGNTGYHVMLGVIGASYSVELTLKALYENTVGRFTAWTAGRRFSDEDRYAYDVASDYARFIHVRPWYEYEFASKLGGLWTDVPLWGAHPLRKWERKLILSAEYGIKVAYASLIEAATRAAYTPQAEQMQFVVTGWTDSLARREPRLAKVASLDGTFTLVATPRYDGFRHVLTGLARSGARLGIREIAGNDDILLTGVAPADWTYDGGRGHVVYALPLPSDPTRKRVAMRVPVRDLLPVIATLDAQRKLAVDHIYDY